MVLKLPAQERKLPARGPTHQVPEWHYPALGDLPKLEESQPPAQLVWVQE
ncbi:hypothetical protein CgS9114_00165 [Corynebacterium glutamicum S9114]|nr:hypothetical protein CgS9114_00165 [Corynebacterium glutamicum S9114]